MEKTRKVNKNKNLITRGKDTINFIKSETFSTLKPYWISDNQRKHQENDREVLELKSSIESSELIEALDESRKAIKIILKKNRLNVRSDILDVFPIAMLKSPNGLTFILGLWSFLISLYGTLNEYFYRKNNLSPSLHKTIKMFNDTIGEDWEKVESEHFSNLDVAFDGAESLVEVWSLFIPTLVAPGVVTPLIEVPLDMASRKNYFEIDDHLVSMYRQLSQIK